MPISYKKSEKPLLGNRNYLSLSIINKISLDQNSRDVILGIVKREDNNFLTSID